MRTIKENAEIAEMLGLSYDSVESMDSTTLSEKMLIKMIREGYVIEQVDGGLAFYRDEPQKRN